MHAYPHTYRASASAHNTGWVKVSSPELPELQTAPPPEFGGPGGAWSPETLLCASLSDCFILTFRALARAARVEWRGLECRVEGILDRVDGAGAQFIRFTTTAKLTLPAGADVPKARELLERAEHGCLIANSLKGERHLVAEIVVDKAECGCACSAGQAA
jgi:organic hydroperoxide reductase OsmC/OhrA